MTITINELMGAIADKTDKALIVEKRGFTGSIKIYVPKDRIDILQYSLSFLIPSFINWQLLPLDRDDIKSIVHTLE